MAIEHDAIFGAYFTSWASKKMLCMQRVQFAKGHSMGNQYQFSLQHSKGLLNEDSFHENF